VSFNSNKNRRRQESRDIDSEDVKVSPANSHKKNKSSGFRNEPKEYRDNANLKEMKEGIIGLKNNSLYCYMNAIL